VANIPVRDRPVAGDENIRLRKGPRDIGKGWQGKISGILRHISNIFIEKTG
jgi:uncharacterized protein (DUF4415 family)